ncbi:MAG: alkaline phosphatase family protein, partial [Egibacteraceae bacterium]
GWTARSATVGGDLTWVDSAQRDGGWGSDVDAVRPDYDGAWVGGIVPALLGRAGAGWLPEPLADAEGTVLLVLDGLGWRMLEVHRERLLTVAGMTGGPIRTVVPSTTAAGLTSISTGVPPATHGIVGYRIRAGGQPLNVLRWPSENGPDPQAVQPVRPFLGREIPVVTRAEFRGSGFTRAHLRGTTLIGWKTTSALVTHVRGLAGPKRRFAYAYYDGIDKVAHEFGLRNAFLPAELSAVDRLVADLLDALPDTWALLVTADHGQVHVGADAVVALDAVAAYVAAYAGEGRFRTLHARTGKARDLHAACADTYGDRAWVLSRDELFDGGWLGPGGSLAVRGRVGDVILAAREPVMFVDPGLAKEASMRSHHGSMTADEMIVPLLAARGRA